VTVTGKCICETNTCQTAQICMPLCSSSLVTCSMQQTPANIVILTSIFTCNDRTCRFLKEAPGLNHRVHKHIYINLTSSIRIPNAERILHKNSVLWPNYWLSWSLMHCPTVIPIFLKYLTNIQYIISSWSLTSKSRLKNPNNFIYIWS